MYEVELKVRADHDRVRSALEARGAVRVGQVRQVDTYYDAPHRDFAETDEALRIRRETDVAAGGPDASVDDAPTATKVTYKGPLVETESKTRQEHETAVEDGDAMAGVLEGLGFAPAATVEKDRECFRVDDYAVALDEVAGLGAFCEVEAEAVEASAVEPAREGAVELLADLGLDADDQIRTSYLDLLAEDDGTGR